MRRLASLAFLLAACLGLLLASAPAAVPASIAARDSFRIGSAGVLCTAEVRPLDPATRTPFDRGYAIVCRDAATAVGKLYALRGPASDALAAVAKTRSPDISCDAPKAADIAKLGPVQAIECRSKAGVTYFDYALTRGRTTFIAEGLGGYDSALRLGLGAIATDRPFPGTVEVATTSAGDPAAFARIQAGALDIDSARAEAYQRNNAGNFAEAAEFFNTLAQRDLAERGATRSAEYLANQGLQLSNLGNFPAAHDLFARAEALGAARDPVTARLLRNYRAIDEANRRDAKAALAELDKPMPPISAGDPTPMRDGTISPMIADRLNRENVELGKLTGASENLQPFERAAILDAQAEQIRGIAFRLERRNADAKAALGRALVQFAAVRGGRVASTSFLLSENYAETGAIAEDEGDFAGAERDLTQAWQIVAVRYPDSATVLIAKARLASLYARHGDLDRSAALYRQIVTDSAQLPGAATAMRAMLGPYFAQLAARAGNDPAAASALFEVGEIMQRPGLAQTQAVLARQLSAGDDEAAHLFRESTNLTREITRASGEVSERVFANPADGTPEAKQLADARARLATLEEDQTRLQSQLAIYPRYRALAPQGLTLADLQKALKPGEAYYQVRVVGQAVYAMLIGPKSVQAARLPVTLKQLSDAVATLRDSIVKVENGHQATYPFDIALAHKLYVAMFGSFADPFAGVDHLIYEPDGPLLQLPANLLVMDQASVDAYQARQKQPKADEYDFRGVAWLGRDRDITTAVSPRSFLDIRAVPPSRAHHVYLGLGSNAPPRMTTSFLAVPSAPPMTGDGCAWPSEAWSNPIKPTELYLASQIVGAGESKVVTGAAFSDTAIEAMPDLNDYRIVHFATHGLVTAPRPECPARPALLTSFGAAGSDGLLSFGEIYDLSLDADIVILSACDTAGMATVAATREAGVTTGGNFALDGLVRAFVGAGARIVVASHWPVPDDYDATKRLILGLFEAPPGTPVATALRAAQRKLMDDPNTSHPYYWSAFAIVGDGERPMLQPGEPLPKARAAQAPTPVHPAG